MESIGLSEFTFRLIVIFIPGVMSFLLVESLTNHKEIKVLRFLVYSLLLGFVCYFGYYCLFQIQFLGLRFTFLQSLNDRKTELNFTEILITSILAIPIGCLVAGFINKKVPWWFAQKIGLSKRFGDQDVWSFVMNLKMPEWVIVRDSERDLMYEGWIHAFSDSRRPDELFLRDVKVFKNSTAEQLYEVPALYISRNREQIQLEFPLLEYTDYIERRDNSSKEEI